MDGEQVTPEDPNYLGDPDYWAAAPTDKLISKLKDRERHYFSWLEKRGYVAMWAIVHEEYYGHSGAAQTFGFQASGVQWEGEDEEWLRFRVAEMRPLVKQQLAMQTRERPEFEGVAINSDHDSLAQVKASESGVKYIYEQGYGEHKEYDVAERAKLHAIAYTWLRWDPHEGPEVDEEVDVPADPATGEPLDMSDPSVAQFVQMVREAGSEIETTRAKTGRRVPTGMPAMRVKSAWEVICDPTRADHDDQDFYIVRERRGKYEVLALLKKKIAAAEAQGDAGWDVARQLRADYDKVKGSKPDTEAYWQTLFGYDHEHDYKDDVIVKHFYRRRSVAMPNGRHTVYVDNVVIEDGPLGHEEMPIPLSSALMEGSAIGYSDAWDLLVLQQMLTDTLSAAATNISVHGNPALVMDRGTDIDADALVNNTMVLTKPQGADLPQYLVPPSMRGDVRWLFQLLERKGMNIAKLNDVVRGNPGENVTSGTFAALLHSIAIENMGEEEKRLKLHRERVADATLRMTKARADRGVMVEVAGLDERTTLQLMAREDFGSIARVKMKAIPAAQRNPGMRWEVIDRLLQIEGAVKDPQQIITYAETGVWKEIPDPTMAENLRMQWENEQLAEGARIEVIVEETPLGPEPYEVTPDVPVFALDNHPRHIRQAISVLASPGAFLNPAIRRGVFVHVMWHLREWRRMPPDLAMVVGVPALSAQVEQQLSASAQQLGPGGEGGVPGPEEKGEPRGTEVVGETETPLPNPAQPPGQ